MRAIYWWFGLGLFGYAVSIWAMVMGLLAGIDGEFARGAYMFLLAIMCEKSADQFMSKAEKLMEEARLKAKNWYA